MTVDEALRVITQALNRANPAQPAENFAFAQNLATALNAIGLIPPTWHGDETASHHRVDTGTVSAPHPTTTTGQSATTTADASWRRDQT